MNNHRDDCESMSEAGVSGFVEVFRSVTCRSLYHQLATVLPACFEDMSFQWLSNGACVKICSVVCELGEPISSAGGGGWTAGRGLR